MNGVKIFTHSWRQVVGNFGMAVRVSGGVWLLLVGLGLALALLALLARSQVLAALFPFGFLVVLVWGVSLVAVVWHRYILLEERPSGFIPSRPGLKVWPYFWRGIGITLIVVLVLLVLFFAATIFIDADEIGAAFDSRNVSMLPSHIAMRWGVGLLVTVIYLRFALTLPAVALDRRLGFAEAWEETKPYFGAIVVLAIILSVVNAAVMMVLGVLMIAVAGSGVLAFAVVLLMLAFQWFYFMLNISTLSTLYGHIVEEREVY